MFARWLRSKKHIEPQTVQKAPSTSTPISPNLKANIDYIEQIVGYSSDIIIRESMFNAIGRPMAIVYTDGLVDVTIINDFIMRSLMSESILADPEDDPLTIMESFTLAIGEINQISDMERVLNHVLSGDSVIFVEGSAIALAANTKGWKDRGVSETSVETVIRGPREAFSESIRTNSALIRRKIKDPNLWLETFRIGNVTKTDMILIYIKGVARESLIAEVRRRLNSIQIDGVFESSNIEEIIQDQQITVFPTLYNSERPDVIAMELMQGKIAILVDGTPFVLIAPALFETFLKASEDYYHRVDISTLIRMLRYAGFLIALLAPSLYVAITTYHQEMIPTSLLISLSAQREGTPFPAFIEALMMEVTFEVLREAALRMPRSIGSALSFVGTLVIGQAAVEAGIISAAMVIVVSITAICSFVFPSYDLSNAIRILRFPMMALAASFGLVGIFVGLLVLVMHLNSLQSFGVPYLSPFAPLELDRQRDAMFRLPFQRTFSRISQISKKNEEAKRKPQ
ncbi:spore germination protein KA [Paenibacillus marchantiophytorum]|uniref:Spore germination protein KA n=1 Tax=Paenibacillus marchantiophytorum TaxID=1619310 RepID=A0ABQ2BQZ1_9BACL|nr:spore germination protein [Paenibacillus marchantiophytorum]GGI43972.1 spore germination protein KA [Paenibacillus marchantiophytorum]